MRLQLGVNACAHKEEIACNKLQMHGMSCAQAQQPRLSHEVLRKHTESSNSLNGNAVLVEQIQALTATHQNLAVQIQALVKVISDQQQISTVNASPAYFPPVLVMLSVLFGVVVARVLLV